MIVFMCMDDRGGLMFNRRRQSADMLFQAGIDYEYEKKLDLGDDGIRITDFVVEDAESGLCVYWEHCGMLGDEAYCKHWIEKKYLYEKYNIIEGENLIVSYNIGCPIERTGKGRAKTTRP